MDVINWSKPLDQVVCYCARCRQILYSFPNQWIRLENYIGPIAYTKPTSNIYIEYAGFPAIIYTGPIRLGKEQTLLADCQVQDMSCFTCQTLIGFKCVVVPDSHVLRDGQMFFLTSLIILVLANDSEEDTYLETGTIVWPLIEKTLGIQEDPRSCFNTPPIIPSSSETNTYAGMSRIDLPMRRSQTLHHLQVWLDSLDCQQSNSSSINNILPCTEEDIAKRVKELDELKQYVGNYYRDVDMMQDSIVSLNRGFSEMNLTPTRIERELTSARQITADLRSALSSSSSSHMSTSTTEQPPPQQETATSDTRPALQDLACVTEDIDGTGRAVKECISITKGCVEEAYLLRAKLKNLKKEVAHKQSLPEDADPPGESTRENTHH